MSANLILNARPSTGLSRLTSCLTPGQQIHTSDWTLEQLNILPYQHLLEVGYGLGKTTQAVARKLRTGFIAGIDCSVTMYQRAYRRNRRAIEQQLLQLHVGNLYELPYPPHYFHTIYGSNAHTSWKDPQVEFMRLANLLKSGGRLVMILHPQWPRQEKTIRESIEKIEEDYFAAGLTDIRIRYKDTDPITGVAITGYKA
jgi:ubiquinone/menaquinone biosynthesis C-methylase UbiE